MGRSARWLILVAALTLALSPGAAWAAAKLNLKASHQFAEGDVRDLMLKKYGEDVSKKLGGDLAVRVYPASSLFKPVQQFDGLQQGTLDISLFPLDYAAGKVPELSITLMPCTVTSLQQAMDWRKKEIGQRIEKLCEANGMKILIWAWLDGAIASTKKMVKLPEDVKGLKLRAAGKKFELMLNKAGASIASMPSSEIYQAMATGVLDTCLTSSASFVSYRLQEQVKFLNTGKDFTIWYMAEPVVISTKTWAKLNDQQKKAFLEVAEDMSANWVPVQKGKAVQDMIDVFAKAKVEIHHMTKAEFDKWLEFAKPTAWDDFAKTVKGGQELLDLAIQAMK